MAYDTMIVMCPAGPRLHTKVAIAFRIISVNRRMQAKMPGNNVVAKDGPEVFASALASSSSSDPIRHRFQNHLVFSCSPWIWSTPQRRARCWSYPRRTWKPKTRWVAWCWGWGACVVDWILALIRNQAPGTTGRDGFACTCLLWVGSRGSGRA